MSERKNLFFLLESNKTIQLLNQLKEILPDKNKEIVMLLSRVNKITQKERIGTLALNDIELEKNKINSSIYDLIIERNGNTQNHNKDIKASENGGREVNQIHNGIGDNIIGNKIINNGSKTFWKRR